MPTITLELPVAGTGVQAGLHATNYADIQALLNGGLDQSNISTASVLSFASLTLTAAAGLVVSADGGKDTINLSNTTANVGITIGGDANLYRKAADVLATDDQIRSYRASGSAGFAVQVTTDSANRWHALAQGVLEWGDGSGAQDTNLYRSAANTLKTDDTFEAVGDIRSQAALRAQYGSATLVAVGDIGGSLPGILFGSGLDTNLYRSAANTLKTDDTFHSAAEVVARAGAAEQVRIGNVAGTRGGITFGSAETESIYSSAANAIKTDDDFIVGSNLTLKSDGWINYTEVSAPSGAANRAITFARDNGSGKTQFCVIFPTGAVQVLATEP